MSVAFFVLACLPSTPPAPADERPPTDAPAGEPEACGSASLWACPNALERPCDARWWVELEDYDDELDDAFAVARLVREVVDANVPAECLLSCEPEDPAWSCSAAACSVDGVTVDYRREWLDDEYESNHGQTLTRRREEVEAHLSPSTGPWTRLDFESSLRSDDTYDLEAQAAWEGAIAPSLPDDDALHFTTHSYGDDDTYGVEETWSSADCDIAVDYDDEPGHYEIILPKSSLQIVAQCACSRCDTAQATLDGATYEVGNDDWRIVGLDRDGDGFSVEGGDCDDKDPAVYPCEGC